MYTVYHIINGRCLSLKEFKPYHEAVKYRNSLIEQRGGNTRNDYYGISEVSHQALVSFYED